MNPFSVQPNPFSSTFTPNATFMNSINGGNIPHRNFYERPAKTKPELIKCDICKIECVGRPNYDIHVQGRKHIRLLNRSRVNFMSGNGSNNMPQPTIDPANMPPPELYCETCNLTCLDNDQMTMHLNGTKHTKKLKLLRYEELKAQKDPRVYCEICDQFMSEDSILKHNEGGKHKRKNTGKSENSPCKKAKIEALGVPTTVQTCGFCNVIFETNQEAVYHYQSSKHIANLQNRTKNFNLWCDLCQVSFHSQDILEKHLNGFKHYTKINRGNKNPEGDLGSKLINQRLKLQALKNKKKADAGQSMEVQNADEEQ